MRTGNSHIVCFKLAEYKFREEVNTYALPAKS